MRQVINRHLQTNLIVNENGTCGAVPSGLELVPLIVKEIDACSCRSVDVQILAPPVMPECMPICSGEFESESSDGVYCTQRTIAVNHQKLRCCKGGGLELQLECVGL